MCSGGWRRYWLQAGGVSPGHPRGELGAISLSCTPWLKRMPRPGVLPLLVILLLHLIPLEVLGGMGACGGRGSAINGVSMAMDMSKEMRAVHPIAIGLVVLSYHHVFEEMRLSAAAMYR
ncbi:unknown protein [Oryza sativa Japonica Group]|uniref:Uncharacterized protein n=1 Tax=Oryza sativa subsp. japonica TaxID=39947 RepID=Q5VR25_ORYSJ|nr:unknown protein [Oryza sativa Japonica Group]